ncbi:MAG: DUF429 domain-containing protein, partial [Planctomycetales bacterium]|nr:DUF429 domain-containing protein [Planctomycetales bacterium]
MRYDWAKAEIVVAVKGGPSVRVVGVDGCPGGWLAVAYDGRTFEPRFHPSFTDMLTAYPNVSCIAVDVPIGLV